MKARAELVTAPRRRRLVKTMLVAVLCMAPVPGDIGSCGQPVQALDATKFFGSKKAVDCQQCQACGIEDTTCTKACDPNVDFPDAFPTDCVPLVHDGEVCLRALLYASCDDYRSYVADQAPTVPTECNFCPGKPP